MRRRGGGAPWGPAAGRDVARRLGAAGRGPSAIEQPEISAVSMKRSGGGEADHDARCEVGPATDVASTRRPAARAPSAHRATMLWLDPAPVANSRGGTLRASRRRREQHGGAQSTGCAPRKPREDGAARRGCCPPSQRASASAARDQRVRKAPAGQGHGREAIGVDRDQRAEGRRGDREGLHEVARHHHGRDAVEVGEDVEQRRRRDDAPPRAQCPPDRVRLRSPWMCARRRCRRGGPRSGGGC